MTICSGCGNKIQIDGTCYTCGRIENEHKRFGQRRPRQPAPINQRKIRRHPIPESKIVEADQKWPEFDSITPPIPLDELRGAFNDYLVDLYKRPRRLSHILHEGGLAKKDIDKLRDDHIGTFLNELVDILLDYWEAFLTQQEYEVLIAAYRFEGWRPNTVESLKIKHGISKSQLDKYKGSGLKRLRNVRIKKGWERLVVKTARELIAK